jgi:threonine synthase
MTAWDPFDLDCEHCGERYPPDGLPPACPRCGGFWRFRSLPQPAESGTDQSKLGGMRRWARVLGLAPEELPVQQVARPAERFDGVWIAHQGSAPAGSYKQRGAEVMAALCVRRGVREVFLDSSGNAGIAVAAACARRGIRCTVLLPSTTPPDKRRAIAAAGAVLEVIDGDRAATSAAAQALRASGARGTYASHIYQPSFVAGVATLVWDFQRSVDEMPEDVQKGVWHRSADDTPEGVWHPREHPPAQPKAEETPQGVWHPPPRHPPPEGVWHRSGNGGPKGDWYLPAGNGALLLGVEMGLDALAAAGQPPLGRHSCRLHAVQLAGYAALHPGGPGPRAPGPPVAAGIAISAPARREAMVRAVRRSGGSVVRVDERQIAAARASLAAAGYFTDATGAAAWAGFLTVREATEVAAEPPAASKPAQTVVLLTSRADASRYRI